MNELLQAIAAFFIVCTAAVVILAKLAKPGFEDADGFHAGEPPEHSDHDGGV